jgi:hypothetical protein
MVDAEKKRRKKKLKQVHNTRRRREVKSTALELNEVLEDLEPIS